jgi:hypothetical protein
MRRKECNRLDEVKKRSECKKPENLQIVNVELIRDELKTLEVENQKVDKLEAKKNIMKQNLIEGKSKLTNIIADYDRAQKKIEMLKKELADLENECVTLLSKKNDYETRISEFQAKIDEVAIPERKIGTDIFYKIQKAEDENKKIKDYEIYQENEKALQEAVGLYKNSETKFEELKSQKTKAIQDSSLQGITLTDDNELLYQGKPIKDLYWSRGELEVLITSLYVRSNPLVKFRFIDDFDLLDEENQTQIIEQLVARDFQILVAEVGGKKGELIIEEVTNV